MTGNTIEVDPVDIVEREVDEWGRISIGTEHEGETVQIAVISSDDLGAWEGSQE